MDIEGAGVITRIWMTFLGPERHLWAKNGSPDHQEMLLRMYWGGAPRPAVETPVANPPSRPAAHFIHRRGRGARRR